MRNWTIVWVVDMDWYKEMGNVYVRVRIRSMISLRENVRIVLCLKIVAILIVLRILKRKEINVYKKKINWIFKKMDFWLVY